MNRISTGSSARVFGRTQTKGAGSALTFLGGICVCIALFATATLARESGKDDGARYLQNVSEKFSRIKDYTVDVKVHPELDNVKAEDMTARVYYKSPDKVKMESKSVSFLPKEVGAFNPRMFNSDNFDVSFEGYLKYDGMPAVKLLLSPKKDSFRDRKMILIVDTSAWLIKEISIEPAPGSIMDAKINYGSFDGYELPSEMDVDIKFQKADSSQMDSNQRRRFGGGLSGSVTIYYSNYKVNSGLSDSLFEKSAASPGEAGH